MGSLLQCQVLLICHATLLLANCLVMLGGKYCMQLSPAGKQHEAVEHCYELWDHADVTVWQLHQRHPDLFRELRLKLLELGVHEVWLEAKAPYEGGVFLHTYSGNSLFNTPVAGLNVPCADKDKSCLTWEVLAMVHHSRGCNPSSPRRYFPAVCLTLQMPVRMTTVGCPSGFYIAPRIIRKCVFLQRTDDFVDWGKATDVCRAMLRDSHVIQLGYSALVHEGYGTCPVGIRKIVNNLGEAKYVWDHKYHHQNEVDGVILRKLSTVNTSQFAYFGAVATGSEPLLLMVADNFTFNCVACEIPFVPLDMSPTLTLTFSLKDGSVNILLDVEHEFTMVTEQSRDVTTAWIVKLVCFTDATSFYPQRVDVTWVHGSYYSLSWKGGGYYWCYAQDVFTLWPLSSNVILAKDSGAASQTWAVLVRTNSTVFGRYIFSPDIIPNDNMHGASYDTLDGDWLCRLGKLLIQEEADLKLKRVYRNGSLLLVHATQQKELKVLSTEADIDGFRYNIIYARHVDYCPCEEEMVSGGVLEWPKTHIGESALLKKECMQYTRACEGDFNVGARWHKHVRCINTWSRHCSTNHETSHVLEKDKKDDASRAVAFSDDGDLVQEVHPEILRAATSLQELAGTRVNKTTLLSAVDIFDKVLNYNVSTFVSGRAAGSDIMQNIDTILKKVEVEEEFLTIVKPNIAVFISGESSEGQIVGISLSSAQHITRERFSDTEDSHLNILQHNQSKNFQTEKNNIDVAVLFSETVSKLKPRMSVIIFGNSALLVSASKWDLPNQVVNSKVVGIVMNGKDSIFKEGFENFVEIIFRPHNLIGKRMCVYWDFNIWSWNTIGCEINSSVGGLDICRCHHITYFAEMIIEGGHELSNMDQVALDVISVVGCTLSLVGLVGIGVTAVVFTSWRQQLSNQLLLSLSAAVGLKMLLFLVVATGRTSHGVWCIVVGAGLHYTLLVSFCWMLLMAVLQYKRLVSVFGRPHPSRLLFKASLFSWGMPSIPVILLLFVDPGLYTTHTDFGLKRKFCYPKGIAFYLAVVLPVTIVTLFNALMFIIIIMNIGNCTNKAETKAYGAGSRKTHLYRALMGLLLFFLLGTTWVFGLLAQITLFAYIFCITATLQGAVLFLFFITGSQKTRAKWNIRTPKFSITNTMKKKTKSTTTRTTSTSKTQRSDPPKVQETYLQHKDVY